MLETCRGAQVGHGCALLVCFLLLNLHCAYSPPPQEHPVRPATDPRTSSQDFVKVEVMPVLISLPAPVYPTTARKAHMQGTVMVRALVGRDGRVHDAFAVDGGITVLNDAAVNAVRKAHFKPAELDGKPIAVWVQVPIRFTLD